MGAFRYARPAPEAPLELVARHAESYVRYLPADERELAAHVVDLPARAWTTERRVAGAANGRARVHAAAAPRPSSGWATAARGAASAEGARRARIEPAADVAAAGLLTPREADEWHFDAPPAPVPFGAALDWSTAAMAWDEPWVGDARGPEWMGTPIVAEHTLLAPVALSPRTPLSDAATPDARGAHLSACATQRAGVPASPAVAGSDSRADACARPKGGGAGGPRSGEPLWPQLPTMRAQLDASVGARAGAAGGPAHATGASGADGTRAPKRARLALAEPPAAPHGAPSAAKAALSCSVLAATGMQRIAPAHAEPSAPSAPSARASAMERTPLSAAREVAMSRAELDGARAQRWPELRAVAMQLVFSDGTSSFHGARPGAPGARVAAAALFGFGTEGEPLHAALALSEGAVSGAEDVAGARQMVVLAWGIVRSVLVSPTCLLVLPNAQLVLGALAEYAPPASPPMRPESSRLDLARIRTAAMLDPVILAWLLEPDDSSDNVSVLDARHAPQPDAAGATAPAPGACEAAWRLCDKLYAALLAAYGGERARPALNELIAREMAVVPTLARMERLGLPLDTAGLSAAAAAVDVDMESHAATARRLARKPDLNLSSPQQLAVVSGTSSASRAPAARGAARPRAQRTSRRSAGFATSSRSASTRSGQAARMARTDGEAGARASTSRSSRPCSRTGPLQSSSRRTLSRSSTCS